MYTENAQYLRTRYYGCVFGLFPASLITRARRFENTAFVFKLTKTLRISKNLKEPKTSKYIEAF
jgi:hypothetical protein